MNVHRLEPQNNNDAERRARIEKIASGVANSVFEGLSDEDRRDVLDRLNEIFRPIAAPRAGDVLEAIVRLLPRKSDWTVHAIKEEVSAKGVSASPKEVYNAIGYLTRKGHIRRIGYGRYVVDGTVLVASDDFGGPTASQEDAYRTDE
jgi:hypothetical protein